MTPALHQHIVSILAFTFNTASQSHQHGCVDSQSSVCTYSQYILYVCTLYLNIYTPPSTMQKVTVIFSLFLCHSNTVYNKVHSAVSVCKAKTGLNHFSILIISAAETITSRFALSSLFAFLSSPYHYSPSAHVCHKRSPISTPSCFMIIFSLITLPHPDTANTHGHTNMSPFLCLSQILMWVWPGHVCSLSSQYRKRAGWLIIVCGMCVWEDRAKKKRKAQKLGCRDCQDLFHRQNLLVGYVVLSFSLPGRRVHGPTVLLKIEGGKTSIHSPAFHLLLIWPIPLLWHQTATQTMIFFFWKGVQISLTLQGFRTFLSDTKSQFMCVCWERRL